MLSHLKNQLHALATKHLPTNLVAGYRASKTIDLEHATGDVLSFTAAGAIWYGFHITTHRRVLRPVFKRVGLNDDHAVIAAEVTRKYIGGAVLFGASAYWLKKHGRNLSDYGWNLDNPEKTKQLLTRMTPIFTGIVAANMQQPVMWNYYPEVRTQNFSLPVATLSASAWAAYLVGFEFFFRGFLLKHWQQEHGMQQALARMTALYTLVHLPNNWREMLSCIPMGYIFGGMSLYTNSIASPLLMHLAVSTTSDVMAARANPNVNFLQ